MATYTKKEWEESENLKKQQQALEAYKSAKPAAYSSENQQLSEDALKNWQNYKPFNYDINADALYNQYKNNYMTQGKLAMQNTMGQAAALTGGYGNSYAQSVGQQAYQSYLTQLNDVVPELYNMAYTKYQQGKEDAYNNWQAYQALEAQDYSRYQDSVNAYNTELDRLMNEYNTAYDREYSQYQYNDQMAYQQYQDDLAQENWQKQFDADQAYQAWQMTMAEKEYALSASKAYSSGSSASSSTSASGLTYNNGNLTVDQVKQLQGYLGLTQTGQWTDDLEEAYGLSADDAYHLAFSAPDSGLSGGFYETSGVPTLSDDQKTRLDNLLDKDDYVGARELVKYLDGQGYDMEYYLAQIPDEYLNGDYDLEQLEKEWESGTMKTSEYKRRKAQIINGWY